MASEANRINFFISMDTIMAYLEKHVVDQSVSADNIYFDCAFTADVIEGPFRLFYRGSREELEFEIDTRFSLYQVEEQESRRKAKAVVNREGELSGDAPEDIRGLLQGYLAFCTSFSAYLRDHGVFDRYSDLDPEKEGILVEFKDDELELKHVSGDDRPDLVCQTLTGELKLMRPYNSDFMKSTLLGMMPAETKEKAAEAGDVDMMHHLFEYYMGNVETPQNDLNQMMRFMKTLGSALGKESEIPETEEEQDTRNPEKAFYWLKKIAETGDAGAMNALGTFYMKAFGTERDFRKAAEWRKKAAENGLEAAEGQEDMLLMMAETKEKAEAGDTEAQAAYANILKLLSQDSSDLGGEKDEAEAFQWAQKSAAKFDLEGIFTLAKFYLDGTGTPKDAGKAFRLFERAAGKGHAPSQARLGQMYFQGEGTAENPQTAYEWSRKAAEAGDANGMSNLAACYLLGKGIGQDPGKAVEWLQKAAAQGDEGAKGLLEKLGVPLKPQREEEPQPQTVEEAEKMAQQGSVKAMKLLAGYYIKRPGGQDDLHEAYKWAKMAADHGDEESKALCEHLESFFSGKPQLVPFEQAKAGAETGDATAQKILADYYATGYETERDLVKALYWMKKAAASGDPRFAEHAQDFVDNFSDIEDIIRQANQGDPQAQAQLAEKYVGIAQNYEYNQENGQRDAFEMAEKSASAGDPRGMYVLGICYENGYGTETDFSRAFNLYTKSAEMSDPRGELSLSQCYLTGRGTQVDADAVMYWLEKSEEHGNPEAAQARELYRQLMPMVAMDKLGDGANSGGPDPVQGARLMQKAAELGSADAQAFLGTMYMNGNHVERDLEKGLEWLQKAADNGSEQASKGLEQWDRPETYFAAANMEFAKKENTDKEKVFRLMKHAAEGGLAVAQDNLGFLYVNGVGNLPDYEAGMGWFQKAADQGNESALRNIQKYKSPDGMFMAAMAAFAMKRQAGVTDCQSEFELLKKAAESGSPEAMNLLGLFCADPTGVAAKFGSTVDQDLEKARSLFEKALQIKPDFKQAENNLKKLADLEAAKETGREPNGELKWAVALKKQTAGPKENTEPSTSEGASAEKSEQTNGTGSPEECRQEKQKEMSQDALRRQYQENGKCRYCGGDFRKGLFSTKCVRCGKKKDY